MFEQKNQNLERLLLDSDSDTVLPQLAGMLIHLKSAELIDPVRHCGGFHDMQLRGIGEARKVFCEEWGAGRSNRCLLKPSASNGLAR
jgi:hypothetical protein